MLFRKAEVIIYFNQILKYQESQEIIPEHTFYIQFNIHLTSNSKHFVHSRP